MMPLESDEVILLSGGPVKFLKDAGTMHIASDAIYKGGTCVKHNLSYTDGNGRPYVTIAGHTDNPIGMVMQGTLDPTVTDSRYMNTAAYQTLQPVAVFPFIPGDRWAMPLVDGHAAIAVGDKIGISAYGEIDKFSSISGCVWSLGVAYNAVAASTASPGQAGVDADCVIVRIDKIKEI